MSEHTLMDLREFVEDGYLQEANRQFFHPLGLALQVTIDGDEVMLSGIWDCHDEEGFVFDEVNRDKAISIMEEQAERALTRARKLGFVIQPLTGVL